MFQLITAYLSLKYSKGFKYFNDTMDDSICVCANYFKDYNYRNLNSFFNYRIFNKDGTKSYKLSNSYYILEVK